MVCIKLWRVIILDNGIKKSCSCSLNDLDILQTFIKGGRILILKFKKGKSLGMKKNYPEKIEGRKLFLQKKADKSTCLSESQSEVAPSCQTLQTCGL